MIWRYDAADGISYATAMATKGAKVVTAIHALFDASDPLFRRLGHKLVIDQLMEFTCAILEVWSV